MKPNSHKLRLAAVFLIRVGLLVSASVESAQTFSEESASVNQVLEWNQIFIDTLIATNTPNSSEPAAWGDRSYCHLRCV